MGLGYIKNVTVIKKLPLVEQTLSEMELTFWSVVALLAVSHAKAQQPLGAKYSQSTDVSHISFNSPLVTYGDSLNAIRLPAAPVRPANLRESPQEAKGHGQTLVRMFGAEEEQNQPELSSQQPQFISVQQFPANPQLQKNDEDNQQQQQYAQQQQQYIPPQQQPLLAPQHQQAYINQQQTETPQQPYFNQQPFITPQQRYIPQQQVASPQLQQSPQQPLQYPQQQLQYSQQQLQYPQQQLQYPQQQLQYPQQQLQYSQQQLQYPQQPLQYPQQQAPVARQQAAAVAQPPFVSRVSFSGPVAGFSYGF